MEINSNLLQFSDHGAVCSVTVKSETNSVTLYATGLASESEWYADLALARALALARQVLEEGLASVTVAAFLSAPQPEGSSEPVPEPAAPTPPVTPASEPETALRATPKTEPEQTTPPATAPATTASEVPVEVDMDDTDETVLDIPW